MENVMAQCSACAVPLALLPLVELPCAWTSKSTQFKGLHRKLFLACGHVLLRFGYLQLQ
jgi:hypothetical protein